MQLQKRLVGLVPPDGPSIMACHNPADATLPGNRAMSVRGKAVCRSVGSINASRSAKCGDIVPSRLVEGVVDVKPKSIASAAWELVAAGLKASNECTVSYSLLNAACRCRAASGLYGASNGEEAAIGVETPGLTGPKEAEEELKGRAWKKLRAFVSTSFTGRAAYRMQMGWRLRSGS